MTVFCDVDGVLCDLNKHFIESYDLSLGNFQYVKGKDRTETVLKNIDYLALEVTAFYGCLINHVDVFITSCVEEGRKGRSQWLYNLCNNTGIGQKDIIYTFNKTKYCKGGDVLIDDSYVNISAWAKAGGIVLQVYNQETAEVASDYLLKTRELKNEKRTI